MESRFTGIDQLYAVGRSLNNIDENGLTVCQVANASNKAITLPTKTPISSCVYTYKR